MDVDGGVVRLQPVTVGGKTSVVEVFVPDAELGDGTARDWWILLGIALGLVIGSVIVVDRLARGAVASARNLVHAAMAVGGGDLGVRIQPSGPRELAEAGYAFNRMADRLVTSRTNERELVADLSHRLRTPLTVLRLDAEALDPDDTHIGEFSAGRAGPPARHPAHPAGHRHPGGRGRPADQHHPAGGRRAGRRRPEDGLCDASEVVRDRMVFWSALAGDQNRQYRVVGAHAAHPGAGGPRRAGRRARRRAGQRLPLHPAGHRVRGRASPAGTAGWRCGSTTPGRASTTRRRRCGAARATRARPASAWTSPAGRRRPPAARSAWTGPRWAVPAW